MILMRSATRITHKVQGVACLTAKWHVCATIDSYETTASETLVAQAADKQPIFTGSFAGSSDSDDVGDEEDEMHNTKFVPLYAYNTISFQRRQALGKFNKNLPLDLMMTQLLPSSIQIILCLVLCSYIFQEQQSWDHHLRVHAGQDFTTCHIRD